MKDDKVHIFWKESVNMSVKTLYLSLRPILKTINELVLIGWKNKLNEIIHIIDKELKRRDKEKENV